MENQDQNRSVMESCRTVVRFLEGYRFPLSDEKRLQEEIGDRFTAAGMTFEREVRLSDRDIIDFFLGGVGIEVKIQGGKREIFRQCERYCAHGAIVGLVLASNVAMGLPPQIHGKPVFLARLGKGWL